MSGISSVDRSQAVKKVPADFSVIVAYDADIKGLVFTPIAIVWGELGHITPRGNFAACTDPPAALSVYPFNIFHEVERKVPFVHKSAISVCIAIVFITH